MITFLLIFISYLLFVLVVLTTYIVLSKKQNRLVTDSAILLVGIILGSVLTLHILGNGQIEKRENELKLRHEKYLPDN